MVISRFLFVYSATVTIVFLATIFWVAHEFRNRTFDRITAQRIDIVEPDGTLRLTISNRAQFPGTFIHGQEYARPDRRNAAGLLFLNDEGTEMGGLTWGGLRKSDGTPESHGHLSFDQYDQNQIFSIDAGREGSKKFSAIAIADRGDWPLYEAIEAEERISKLPQDLQAPEWRHFEQSHPGYADRIYLGRESSGSAVLRMKDSQGRDRLVLCVDEDGKTSIQFLGADGKVNREIDGPR
jgi:hypothetical protein